MTETVAALAVAIPLHQRLTDIFGGEAVGRALEDFGMALHDLCAHLLEQHAIVDRRWRDEEARWITRFRMRASDLPRDDGEAFATIERAGHRLAHDLLVSVFGTGTGMRVPLQLAVLPLPPEATTSGACPFAWVDAKLGDVRPKSPDTVPTGDIERILATRSVRTHLQPIVRMRDRTVVGYEALSRGPRNSPLERPDHLFDAAHAAGRTVEMELLCARLALERTRGKLPGNAFLAINLGPEALLRASELLPLAGPNKLMFELTEHLPLGGAENLRATVADLRARGVQVALDDTGCGFADMDTVRVLRPDIVKLCITVVRNAERGSPFVPAIAATAERLLGLGCRVLAEGVETEGQHVVMSGCRIGLAQGWLYGRPLPIDRETDLRPTA